jgi:hypothetical protein
MRIFRASVTAFAVVAAIGLAGQPVLASSSHQTGIPQAILAGPPPPCTGYVTANPTYQSDAVNTNVTVNVNWYCEGSVHVVANIQWKDGNTDNYTCWANCTSGSTQFNHVYTSRATFYPYIYMNGSASGSTSVQIYIY